MDYIMETVGLRKAYKDNIVVDDVNMHISKGAIYGFVGPNGAGKSTVMKMILSLIQPDAGEVQLLGEKVTSVMKYSKRLVLLLRIHTFTIK